jgi:hypothetical protein
MTIDLQSTAPAILETPGQSSILLRIFCFFMVQVMRRAIITLQDIKTNFR